MLHANYSRLYIFVTVLLKTTSLGQKYIIYLAKGGYLVLNDIPVDDKFIFNGSLPEPKCTKV